MGVGEIPERKCGMINYNKEGELVTSSLGNYI